MREAGDEARAETRSPVEADAVCVRRTWRWTYGKSRAETPDLSLTDSRGDEPIALRGLRAIPEDRFAGSLCADRSAVGALPCRMADGRTSGRAGCSADRSPWRVRVAVQRFILYTSLVKR